MRAQIENTTFSYKDDIGVPPLAMVDDVLTISKCGVESVEMNAYMNQKTNIKRLQFGPEKCHQLHIGPKQITCPDLFINTWKLKKREEYETGIRNLVDVENEDHKIEKTEEEKYSGDIITIYGKNVKNIVAKIAKAQAIIKQIKCILEGGRLFGGTVPPNNFLFGGTVQPNDFLFGGTCPAI